MRVNISSRFALVMARVSIARQGSRRPDRSEERHRAVYATAPIQGARLWRRLLIMRALEHNVLRALGHRVASRAQPRHAGSLAAGRAWRWSARMARDARDGEMGSQFHEQGTPVPHLISRTSSRATGEGIIAVHTTLSGTHDSRHTWRDVHSTKGRGRLCGRAKEAWCKPDIDSTQRQWSRSRLAPSSVVGSGIEDGRTGEKGKSITDGRGLGVK